MRWMSRLHSILLSHRIALSFPALTSRKFCDEHWLIVTAKPAICWILMNFGAFKGQSFPRGPSAAWKCRWTRVFFFPNERRLQQKRGFWTMIPENWILKLVCRFSDWTPSFPVTSDVSQLISMMLTTLSRAHPVEKRKSCGAMNFYFFHFPWPT